MAHLHAHMQRFPLLYEEWAPKTKSPDPQDLHPWIRPLDLDLHFSAVNGHSLTKQVLLTCCWRSKDFLTFCSERVDFDAVAFEMPACALFCRNTSLLNHLNATLAVCRSTVCMHLLICIFEFYKGHNTF